MAELITTAAEKAAASYLDWDDAALGKAVKALAINVLMDHAKGDQAIAITACATMLACEAAASNAATTVFNLDGVTEGDVQLGDFSITIERTGQPTGVDNSHHGMICVARTKQKISVSINILQNVKSGEYIPCCNDQVGEPTSSLDEAKRRSWQMLIQQLQGDAFLNMAELDWQDETTN